MSDKNGKKEFSAIYANQNGDTIEINAPYYMEQAKHKNANQNFIKINAMKFVDKLIG